jgi:hypothetical protein
MKSEFLRFTKRSVRQGTWTLLQRYLVAHRILHLPPVEFARASDFCVQMRICERDAILAHWTLRSLHHHLREPVMVMVHHNDECSKSTLISLREKFRHIQLVSRTEALAELAPKLRPFPILQHWRNTNYGAIKVLDFYLIGRGKYSVFLDADILFFKEPSEVFERSDEHLWMKDCWYWLALEPNESQSEFGGNALQTINTGLGRVTRGSMNLKLLQDVYEYLHRPKISARWQAKGIVDADDMTYNAVLSASAGGCRLLADTYPVATEPGLHGLVAKHYTSPVRYWMYEEGLPRVAKQLGMQLPLWLRERM